MIRSTFGILLVGNATESRDLVGAGVLSVRKKRYGTSLPSHEGLSAGRSPRAHVVFPH